MFIISIIFICFLNFQRSQSQVILDANEANSVIKYLDAIGCGDGCPLNGFTATNNCSGPNLLCNQFGEVTRLVLHDANLQGRAESSHLSGLSALTHLSLMNNPNLKGILPTEIAQMPLLRLIEIVGASLSGTIGNLLRLSSLTKLDLSRNQLKGSIPVLPNSLERLFLKSNQLTGTIPAPLPSNLKYLEVSDNQLTGDIPLPNSLTTCSIYSTAATAKNCFDKCGAPCLCDQTFHDCPKATPAPPPSSIASKASISFSLVVVLMSIF